MSPHRLFLLLVLLAASVAGRGQQRPNPGYDKALADSLGADENGMKRYVLVLLKTGATVAEGAVRDSLFRGHMANIDRLAGNGKLVVAGPLQKNERTYRGLFILNVSTVEEAKALVATDPAVKAGVFDAEYFQWYGSGALPLYLPHHDRLRKQL